MNKKFTIAILCGGPSLERGISLNSARSLCDHLHSDRIEIIPIYFDFQKKPYLISRAQLYSNTPSDFDFKLKNYAKPLRKTDLYKLLKKADIAFPAMHGPFGEDGEIQKFLETNKISFIGTGSTSCETCFDKYNANEFIAKHGFYTMPSILLKKSENEILLKEKIRKFFSEYKLSRAIVKPTTCGSSIGVHSVSDSKEAFDAAREIFDTKLNSRAVLEPFCEGTEFTVIVLENFPHSPVALFPTEIETDYKNHQIFDYRKKYLASRFVRYHCPPRFDKNIIEKIQAQAEKLFALFGLRDFARFDGWLLKNGNIWFSDFNPVSGMEQNSFLFLQSAQLGLSHQDLLYFILKNACSRYKINPPQKSESTNKKRKNINVLFGGNTSERQVSVMTGTNAWLKLRNSKIYNPVPFLLDKDNKTVWKLPYSKTLYHTAEEISDVCRSAKAANFKMIPLRKKIIKKLFLSSSDISENSFIPEKITLDSFIKNSKYIFIGLHGGIGENGVLQKKLEKICTPFNGSRSEASALCMDKYATSEKLKSLESIGVYTAKKKLFNYKELIALNKKQIYNLWETLKSELKTSTLIVKPRADGCSTGIVQITTKNDLSQYINLLKNKAEFAPPHTFKNQITPIEMPANPNTDFFFEKFIETDSIRIIKNKLKWKTVSDWIEITIGVLGKNSKIKALNPSLTVATGRVLSLEEKFQGGTGINITPPPSPYVKKTAISNVRKRIVEVAKALGTTGYARIDAFMHIKTGELIIIEVNTTPALTPSTVLFHQALLEKPSMYPLDFLEKIIKNS